MKIVFVSCWFVWQADRTLEEQLEFFSVYGLPDVNGKKRSKDSEELRVRYCKTLV